YYDRAQDHLEDAKTWYQQARPKAEVAKEQADQKVSELEDKLGEAGSALAKRERQVRSLLRDLLKQATDSLRDGDKETAKSSIADIPPTKRIDIDRDEL
ncbi:MAG: histidine kinase, partial [Candidatus Parcubacteria bacterium]|nr:histidine kinase [Leptolyngbyaceae cyanobacterium LF-bin-113]